MYNLDDYLPVLPVLEAAIGEGYSVDMVKGVVLGKAGYPLKSWMAKRGGYPTVKLYTPVGTRSVSVHQFVAYCKYGPKAFLRGTDVRHLDGNPENCNQCNIGIGTRAENIADIPADQRRETSRKRGLKLRGHLGAGRKLSDDDVASLRRDVQEGGRGSQRKAAHKYGIHESTVSKIIAGDRY